MPKFIVAVGLCSVLVGIDTAHADEPLARLDGVWTTVISCTAAVGALPYTYEFTSTVTNSVLHGEKGIKGAPGWLQLDGSILPDGSAAISAHGLVGKERAAIGERPSGTPYHYRIEAKFSENSGTGHRATGRTCAVSFSKKGS
jgi:hypothetical protein